MAWPRDWLTSSGVPVVSPLFSSYSCTPYPLTPVQGSRDGTFPAIPLSPELAFEAHSC